MRKSIHCCYLNQKIQHHLSSSDIEQDLSVTLKEISYKVNDSLNKDSEDLFAFAWLDAPSSDIDQYKKEFSQFSNRFFLHPITKLICKPHNSSNNSSHQLSIGLHHAVLHKVNHSTSFLEDFIEKPELSIVSALKHCCDTFGINNRRWLDLYRSFNNTDDNDDAYLIYMASLDDSINLDQSSIVLKNHNVNKTIYELVQTLSLYLEDEIKDLGYDVNSIFLTNCPLTQVVQKFSKAKLVQNLDCYIEQQFTSIAYLGSSEIINNLCPGDLYLINKNLAHGHIERIQLLKYGSDIKKCSFFVLSDDPLELEITLKEIESIQICLDLGNNQAPINFDKPLEISFLSSQGCLVVIFQEQKMICSGRVLSSEPISH